MFQRVGHPLTKWCVSQYIYICRVWSLIKPITHRMRFTIQGWDQYICCASWKPGPPQSQTLRGGVCPQFISGWLEKFRDVTTQMSTIYQPMLSHTHAIFCGLQEHLCESIHNLPSGTDLCIQHGLLAAHQKLAEYYYRFDQSPFYIWATRMSVSLSITL